MKFQEKGNPYFGGGKMTMREWVQKELEDMRKEQEKDNFESKDEYHYGVNIYKIYEIIIAGGGPSMRIQIDTQGGEITGGRYHYGWWGDDEEVELSDEEAETIVSYYGIYSYFEE